MMKSYFPFCFGIMRHVYAVDVSTTDADVRSSSSLAFFSGAAVASFSSHKRFFVDDF